MLSVGYPPDGVCYVWSKRNPFYHLQSNILCHQILARRFQNVLMRSIVENGFVGLLYAIAIIRHSSPNSLYRVPHTYISSLRYWIPMTVERWYTCGHLKDCGWLHQNILLNAKPFLSKRPSGPFENFLIFSVQYFIGAIIVETSVGFVMAKGASIMLTIIGGERRCLCRHRMAVCRSIPYQCSSATD